MISVSIVDDDPLVAGALKTIIGADGAFRIRSVEESGEALLHNYGKVRSDIILMDIRMKGMTGIEAGKTLLSRYPEARILFLTTFSDDEYIVQALKMGAAGYLLKQNYDCILPALHAVYAGQRIFGEAVADRLPQLMQAGNKASFTDFNLSEREFTILRHVADGLSNREIGEKIFLGEGTVRNYVSTILEKLNLRDRTQLAVFYYRNFV